MAERISADEARRAQLAAQGMPRKPQRGRPSAARLLATIRRQGALQIDSVNVLARAQLVPPFSRIGPYDTSLIDRLAYRDRAIFETWAHQASYVPTEMWPVLEWRRRRRRDQPWSVAYREANAAYLDGVLDEVRDRGPLSASELDDPGKAHGPWWGWGRGKLALEHLFGCGEVMVSGRRAWERLYDVPERVLPPDVLSAAPVAQDDALRQHALHAVGALGVATPADVADYWQSPVALARQAVEELLEAGSLQKVEVIGWPAAASRAAAALPGLRIPRSIDARALVSPFDPLLWDRRRTERCFGFHYRIEIYVPAAKRQHGYYVLPFLLGERFAAKVDLKAARATGTLQVLGAWGEPAAGRSPAEVASALRDELNVVAQWLQLESITVARKGDLAAPLRRALP